MTLLRPHDPLPEPGWRPGEGGDVDDQQRAADSYTSQLGFQVTADVPMGEHHWLTVRLGDSPDATEVSLEPKRHPAVAPFTDALAAVSHRIEEPDHPFPGAPSSHLLTSQPESGDDDGGATAA